MPFSFQIDKELGTVLFKATGAFTSRDMLTCVEAVVNDPDFRSEFDHLVDLRQITSFEASPEDLRTRVDRDRRDKRLNASRIAIVSVDDLVFGMTRMYEILMDEASVKVHTFRTMELAIRAQMKAEGV